MGRQWKRVNPNSWVVEMKKAHKTYSREEFDSFHAAHHRAHTLRCLHSLDPQTLMIHQHLRMIRVDATSYYSPRYKAITDGLGAGAVRVNGSRRTGTC